MVNLRFETLAADKAVPLGDVDLLSIITHEFDHGVGSLGLIDPTAPASGAAAASVAACPSSFSPNKPVSRPIRK